MSDVMICGECGQLKPKQRVVCPKHDFIHDPDKHCDHCENEIAAQLEAEWIAGMGASAAADAKTAAELADKIRKATQGLIDVGTNNV